MTAILTEPTAKPAKIVWPRLAQFHLWHWLVFLVVLALVSLPLGFLVLGSFSTASLPTDFSFATNDLRQ